MTTMTTPTHAQPTATERFAAKRAGRWAASLEARVLRALVDAAEPGLTAPETVSALGLSERRHYSVAPRLSAMKRRGWVELTGTARRWTDSFGEVHEPCVAYRVTAAGCRQLEGA